MINPYEDGRYTLLRVAVRYACNGLASDNKDVGGPPFAPIIPEKEHPPVVRNAIGGNRLTLLLASGFNPLISPGEMINDPA